MTAVMAAMVVSGTCRMLSSWGIAITMMPPYIPNTEVRPISPGGAIRRGGAARFLPVIPSSITPAP
jgi:hypothetical protein